MKRIHDSLNDLFHRHRLIFWYDDAKEWESALGWPEAWADMEPESRIQRMEHVEETASSAREKTAATKEADKLRKTLKECREWERDILLPLAQQRLEIDLDDGVKANYPKFGKALAPIPGLS